MTTFRFLHAADIHLDSPLKGLAQRNPAASSATREAFDNLVSQAIHEKVSFMVIAGDLYDGDWRDFQTGLFFVQQMGRCAKAGIPAFLLHGNHDAESQITRNLALPENVKVFSARNPQTYEVDHAGVVLHGQSFQRRDVTDNLAAAYPEPVPNNFNIGVLHTALGGLGGHENYAPCHLNDLVYKGYDYWALGHVHQSGVLHERPHVVFPGNAQGRHIRETGPKGACLVTVEDGEVSGLSWLHSDVLRWAQVHVPVDACHATGEVVDRIREAMDAAISASADGRLMAFRIELTGRTQLHDALLSSTEQMEADVQAAMLAYGDDVALLERLVVATESLLDDDTLRLREDMLGELHRMLGEAGQDAALLGQLEGEIGELVRRLPAELRGDVEDAMLKAAIEKDYGALIARAGGYLTARLTQEGR